MTPETAAEPVSLPSVEPSSPGAARVVRFAPWPASAPAGGRRPEAEAPDLSHLATRLLVQRVPVLAWSTDPELRVTWGLKHRSLASLAERLGHALAARDPHSAAVAAHVRALAGEPAEFGEDGPEGAMQAHVEPLRGASGAVEGTVGVATVAPAEPQRREREELVRAGLQDALTRLPGRTVFLERLRRATAATDWCLEGLFVLLLDLDRFRDVNERFGSDDGDRLLEVTAQRLQRRLRPSDTVARYGGDVFAVMLSGIRDARDALFVAERLQREVMMPFAIANGELRATASVGVAAGMAGQRPEALLGNVERALGRAKVAGRAGCQLFEPGQNARATLLDRVEAALRRALELDELRTHYRPTVTRKDGRVAGFEVVLWKRRTEAELAKESRS